MCRDLHVGLPLNHSRCTVESRSGLLMGERLPRFTFYCASDNKKEAQNGTGGFPKTGLCPWKTKEVIELAAAMGAPDFFQGGSLKKDNPPGLKQNAAMKFRPQTDLRIISAHSWRHRQQRGCLAVQAQGGLCLLSMGA